MSKINEFKKKFLDFFNKNFGGKEILAFVFLSILSLTGFFLLLNSLMQRLWIDRIVYNGEISEGIVGTASHIHIVFGNEESTKSIYNILFSPLLKYTESNEIIYELAEKVDYNKENKEYNIKLKNNIFFQNKNEITVDDVLYTYDLLKKSEYTKTYKNILENTEITKIDNKNFKIRIKNETDKINEILKVGILSKNVFENNETEKSMISEESVGSSAFKIYKIERNQDTGNTIKNITFERFKNGTDKVPYIKNFSIYFFGNTNDAADALYKGKINLIANIDADGLERLKIKNQNLKTQTTKTDKEFALFINQSKNEILQSKKFRQAISLSIDRNYLAKNVMKEFMDPKEFLFNENITNFSIDNSLTAIASTSLIIEDGKMYNSTKKDGKKVKTGEQITLSITTPKVKELEDAANFIKSSLDKIGIKTEVNVLSNESFAEVLKNRDFEIILLPFNIETHADLYNFFHSDERKYPKLNISNYVNKNIDKWTET
jgi:ABC-type transport system substrate-binding protein